MKIVHVASEYSPIAKVGGLGDVVAGLSKEQKKLGHEVKVILPKYDGLTSQDLTLIDLPDDFNRNTIYGEKDDTARFSNFCHAALPHLEGADIVHLHDWPTALLAKLTSLKTILTIHNIAYQGDDLLATGIEHADVLTTVSPTYAKEILSDGFGLEPLLQKKPPIGILNGIDTEYWNPATDPLIPHTYTTPEGKTPNKQVLCDELGLPVDKPLFAAICRLVHQKGPELLLTGIEHILKKGHTMVLLGSSPDPDLQQKFASLSHPNLHLHFEFDEPFAHRLYAAADYILIPSLFEPCGLTQLIGMRYGAIPIAHAVGGLADTVIEGKTGYSFNEPHDFTNAIDRACKDHLAKTAMALDYSWKISAKKYLDLYASA